MLRFLLVGILLFGTGAAQAQQAASQPDTLASLPAIYLGQQSAGLPGLTSPALAPSVQDQLRLVPGMQVTPYSGSPGADVVLRLRGASGTVFPSQPLLVIDGLPAVALTMSYHEYGLSSGNKPFQRDFNPLLLLPSQALDSVSVLSDAGSTARYGIQGANGVLAFNTATGSGPERLRIDYTAQLTAQQVRRPYELLQSREFAELRNEVLNGYAPFTAQELAQFGPGTDWQQELYRTGIGTDHRLRLGGQSEKGLRYAAQAGYLRQNGSMQNSDLTRYTTGISLEQQLLPHLQVRGSVLATQLQEHKPTGSAVQAALFSSPLYSVRAADGAYTQPNQGFQREGYLQNAVWLANSIYSIAKTKLLLSRLAATYTLGSDWELAARAGYDHLNQNAPSYGPQQSSAPYDSERNGTKRHDVHTLAGSATLRYQHRFGAAHAVTAALEYMYQTLRYSASNEYRIAFPAGSSSYSGTQSPYKASLHNQLLTASYIFREAFDLQTSLWVTKVDKARATYPGVQFTWRAERMPWLKNAQGLTHLHTWVGAGQTATGLYERLYSVTGPSIIVAPDSPLPPAPPDELLRNQGKPERTTQLEAGISAGLWQRLQIRAAAYQRRSRNLPVPVWGVYQQQFSYFSLQNAVDVRNRGLELSLSGNWQMGKLTASTRLAAATNDNEVERVPDSIFGFNLSPGQPIGAYYGLHREGTYPATDPRNRAGQIRYRSNDSNGINSSGWLGNSIPKYTLSLAQHLARGRFAFDAQLDAMGGYQIYNDVLAQLDMPTGSANTTTLVRDRWTATNQQTAIPRAGARPLVSSYSDAFLSNGAHLRLTELVVSYRLPTARPVTVFAGGRNVFILTKYRGYDPNVSSSGADSNLAGRDSGAYPVPRTFLLGLQASL